MAEGRHALNELLSKCIDRPDSPEAAPEMYDQLPTLFETVNSYLASGEMVVCWSGVHEKISQEQEATRRATIEAAAKQMAEAKVQAITKERIDAAARQMVDAKLEATLKEIEDGFDEERHSLKKQVRALQNQLQELRGSIRVFCRLRPGKDPKDETRRRGEEGTGCKVEGTQRMVLRKSSSAQDPPLEFNFDCAFGPRSSQHSVYEEVEPLLPRLLEGYHLCVFAYGQTGAGKTYTLAGGGQSADAGLQSRAIADVIRLVQEEKRDVARRSTRGDDSDSPCESSVELWLSALEIYNETIQDLLVDTQHDAVGSVLDIRQETSAASSETFPSPFGSMRVPGLKMRRVESFDDVKPALKRVAQLRHTAATALNDRSSRSHCILSFSIVRRGSLDDEPASTGTLHIVDLAGSERTKISRAEGQQMREANSINKSLAALTDVLFALGDDSTHVPYRNSKLTYLMQDALGGAGCKTLLFANVSPDSADVNETYSTLTFASRVATTVQKGRLRRSKVPGAMSVSTVCSSDRKASKRNKSVDSRSTTPRGRSSSVV
jgi:hypothetical protein